MKERHPADVWVAPDGDARALAPDCAAVSRAATVTAATTSPTSVLLVHAPPAWGGGRSGSESKLGTGGEAVAAALAPPLSAGPAVAVAAVAGWATKVSSNPAGGPSGCSKVNVKDFKPKLTLSLLSTIAEVSQTTGTLFNELSTNAPTSIGQHHNQFMFGSTHWQFAAASLTL